MRLYQTHPDKMKWRTTPFPWFEDILNILGDSLATGRYSFAAGENTNDENMESAAILPSSHAATPRQQSDDDDDESETQDAETQEPKRTRNSGPPPPRKKRVTGLDVIEKMAEGMTAMAESMKPSHSSESQPQKILQGTIDYDVQALAQEKVQEETCLTDPGILFMLDRFTDPGLARTYLSLRKESLRIMFLKKQVEKEDEDYFIDWSED
jgi:hypothetical protein